MALFATEPGCDVKDLQMGTVMIALQGPQAPEFFESLMGVKPGRFKTATAEFDGGVVSMAGTGYTGEKGGELVTDPDTGRKLIEALVSEGVAPCGLGARDTLRLEAGLPLWGNDIDETTTPLEAGLNFAVSLDHEFVGRQRLIQQSEQGVDRKLTGFVLAERGIPRSGYVVRTADGGEGTVTSGNLSPMLDTGVGLAYVSPPTSHGTGAQVEIRGRWVPGVVKEPPFHKDGG